MASRLCPSQSRGCGDERCRDGSSCNAPTMGTGDGARVATLRFLSAKRALAELRSVTNQTSIGLRSPPILRGLACDPLDYNRACPAFPQELNKHRVPELRTNKLVRTTHANACSPRTKLPRRPLRDVLGVSFFTPRISHTFELDPGAESMKEESFERWRDCGRTCKVEASRGLTPFVSEGPDHPAYGCSHQSHAFADGRPEAFR